MEKLTPKVPAATQRFWYGPDTPAGRLERHLAKKGLLEVGIGDASKHDKVHMIQEGPETGEVRYSFMDLEPGMRAQRTVNIKQLSKEGLDKVHAYEQKRMRRWLLREEMELVAGEQIMPRTMDHETKQSILAWCNRHRPPCAKFDGLVVPPYFHYDNEFDGMTYQHAWDWNCYNAEMTMPKSGRGRLSDSF